MRGFKILLVFVALFFLRCNDDQDPVCNQGEVILSVSEKIGTLHFNQQRETYYIRYFIEGTIDTNYVGFVCTNAFPQFEFTEGMTISFSGNFRETTVYDNNDFTFIVGGQEVYLLELQMLAAE